jgi:carotenoid cleavage dioxygenase-like enzyme
MIARISSVLTLVGTAAGSAYELELSRELRSLGVCRFGGAWSTADHWTENFTAHSKVDPATGELVYMGYNLVPVAGPPTVSVGVVDAGGSITHRATLPVARPSMQHDMVRAWGHFSLF